jgi:hypothetical protein
MPEMVAAAARVVRLTKTVDSTLPAVCQSAERPLHRAEPWGSVGELFVQRIAPNNNNVLKFDDRMTRRE